MKKINVKLKENPYPLIIERGLSNKLSAKIKKYRLGNLGLVVASPKILKIYKKEIRNNFSGREFRIISTGDGEKAKSRHWFFKLIKEILHFDKAGKKPYLVCLGGGTIGDAGGFIASIYKRGIPYIQVPTTLIGQIDSSIGGKTAINLPEAKNILGSFYQPRAVLIDPDFLNTLTEKEIKEGLAEVIKYAVINDHGLFYFLKTNCGKIKKLHPPAIDKIIYTCAKNKASIAAADEKEKKGIRTILNFGHTFAHALESVSGYKKISHGNAVSVGMVYTAYLSQRLGKSGPGQTEAIKEILNLFGLPTTAAFDPKKISRALVYDKKFITGKIRMVLLREIGKVEVSSKIGAKDLNKTFIKVQKSNLER